MAPKRQVKGEQNKNKITFNYTHWLAVLLAVRLFGDSRPSLPESSPHRHPACLSYTLAEVTYPVAPQLSPVRTA